MDAQTQNFTLLVQGKTIQLQALGTVHCGQVLWFHRPTRIHPRNADCFRSVPEFPVTQARDFHARHQRRKTHRSVDGTEDRKRKIWTFVLAEIIPGHQCEKNR